MITKLRCILLEDELPGLKYLKLLCEQMAELEVVKAFDDPERFLSEESTLKYDLCILDIEMPKYNGMQVAKIIRDKLVIFTTAFKRHAADAFEVDAVDFVTKPVTKERLKVAVKKALARKKARDNEKQIVHLMSDKGKILVNVHDIAFVTTSEVDSRDKVVSMMDRSTIVLKNVSYSTLLDMLPQDKFCRVSKRQVISLSIVASYAFDEITTTIRESGGPLRIALSEAYRREFRKAVSTFL